MPAPRRPEALRGAVFRRTDAVGAGLVTPAELRSSAWRRLFRGVYADAAIRYSIDLRVAGAALLIPASAVFSGRTAAYLHGATELADLDAPIEVSVPTGVRFGPVVGLRVRQVVLPDDDTTVLARQRLTTPVRTALDLARSEPLPDAVAALDVLLGRRVLTVRDLERGVVALPVARGATKARRAVALADGRAESQQESRLRAVLAVAGMFPVPQFVVRRADGSFIARVDLAFPDLKVAIEYDGAWHGEAGQLSRDRRRLNELIGAGWAVFHVTAADLHDPARLVARVKAFLRSRNFGESAR